MAKFTIRGGEVESKEGFKNASKGGGGNKFATRLPKAGEEIVVRFLTEPYKVGDVPGWVHYDQVWDAGLGRYVLITDQNEDQYEGKVLSRRFLTAALNTNENKVIALELPKSLATAIEGVGSEPRIGSITAGDFVLSKSGSGKDTEYKQVFLGKDSLDVSKYYDKLPDLWKIVENMVEGAGAGESDASDSIEDDTDNGDEDEAPKATKPAAARKITIAKRG